MSELFKFSYAEIRVFVLTKEAKILHQKQQNANQTFLLVQIIIFIHLTAPKVTTKSFKNCKSVEDTQIILRAVTTFIVDLSDLFLICCKKPVAGEN